MKKVKIEKTVAGEVIQSFEVPLLLVNLATKFLPTPALKELEKEGIDLNKMLEIAESGNDYIATMDVVECDIKIKVVISLINQ